MLRSVLSVLAGIVVLSVASFTIEAVVNPLLLRAFPQALPNAPALSSNPWARTLAFTYGLTCVTAGGYVAARIARRFPVRHAAAMGILQAGLTVAAMLSPEGNHASPMQWIVISILSIPAALAGGFLYKGKRLHEGLEKDPAGA
jgi:hypothetical protein